MATNTELASAIANCTGQPETALRSLVIILRDAGLISMRGRGISAAKMDETDAANLLLATMLHAGGVKQVNVVARLEDLRSLRIMSHGTDDEITPWFNGAETLADALSALIRHGGDLERLADRRAGRAVDDLSSPIGVTVEICLPTWNAEIDISQHMEVGQWKSLYRANFNVDADRFMAKRYQRSEGDMTVLARVGYRTIIMIAECLRD